MSNRMIALVGVLLVLGIFFAPRRPSTARVDPCWLLEQVIKSENNRTDGFRCPESRYRLMWRNYIPLVEGEENIGGQACWVLRLKPRIKRRPWRQLWVDRQSFAIMAVREWRHDDRIRRTARADKPAEGCTSPSGPNIRKMKSQDLPLPRWLPRGYELLGEVKWPYDDIRQVVYSDGLFNISVFYRPARGPQSKANNRPKLMDCDGITAARVQLSNYEVTCVADMRADNLRRIVASIH